MKTIKILLIVLCTFSASMASAQTKTLVYTDHEPLGNMRTRFINEVFFPAIEKESNGRLKIEAHWGGELSISYDALKTVAGEGMADMGIIVPEYTPNELPLHQIFKSFPVGPSGQQQVDFFRRTYAELPVFPEELSKANLVHLFFATGYPTAFFSVKPMNTLEEIKGKKWRAASFWHKNFLKNAGAIPVTIPWGADVYSALQADSLDGVMVNIDSGHDINLQKVAPHILLSKDLWMGHIYLLVINKNTWNGLLEEDRKAIQRAAEIAYKTLGNVMNNCLETQINELKKSGATVRTLIPEEVAQFKAETHYTELQSAWIKEQEEKGVKNVATVMEKVSSIVNDMME